MRHLLIANLSKNLGNEDPDCHSGIQLLESLDPLVLQLLASENQSIVTLQVCVPVPIYLVIITIFLYILEIAYVEIFFRREFIYIFLKKKFVF